MMKYGASLLLFPLSFLAPAVAGAEIPADIDQAFLHYAELPDKLVPILSSAVDKASADAAADSLFRALPALYDSQEELRKWKSLPPELAPAIREKYEQRLRTGWGEVYQQIFRLQKAKCFGSLPFFRQFQTMCRMLES